MVSLNVDIPAYFIDYTNSILDQHTQFMLFPRPKGSQNIRFWFVVSDICEGLGGGVNANLYCLLRR